MLLHDLGLEESVRALALGLSTPTRRIVTDFPDRMPSLEEATEVGLYRIAQEALTNAARHAHARLTTLALATDGDRVRLVVRDDGRGFDPHAVRGRALGITGMEQRATAIGGHLELEAAPGRGTTVTLECPLRIDERRRGSLLRAHTVEHNLPPRQRPRTT
jgi:signal transduction histidine kinase